MAGMKTSSSSASAEGGRIALVIPSLGPGGAERVLTTLAGAWADSGRDVVLVTLAGSDGDFFPVPPGVRRVALGMAGDSRGIWEAVIRNVSRVRRLRRALAELRPDLVISFVDQMNVLAILAARPLAIPVVASERIDPRHNPLGWAWRFLRRRIYPRAAAVVVQTEAVRPWAVGVAGGAMVAVIPNPVMPAPPGASRGAAADVILTLGRLIPQKGHADLIRAFARCAGACPGVAAGHRRGGAASPGP